MSAAQDMVMAVVQVGARETRYLRCGAGVRTAVVLAESEPERLRLVRRFAAQGRALAPLPPLDEPGWPAEAAAWLRGIIDGLGLDRPTLVLSPVFASLAADLASGPAWVGDVLIASGDDAADGQSLAAAPA